MERTQEAAGKPAFSGAHGENHSETPTKENGMQQGDAMHRTVEFIEAAVGAEGFDEFSSGLLSFLTDLARTTAAFLYVSDPRLRASHFAAHGLSAERASGLEGACPNWFEEVSGSLEEADMTLAPGDAEVSYTVHPLPVGGRVIGIVGTRDDGADRPVPGELWSRLLAALGRVADRLAAQASAERKLVHLTTYLTVSTMLAKSVDLAELLEIALYCSMEAASAEAASILLLDEQKENFLFYRVEGSAKPLLGGSTFPVTEGVAGRVLETLEAEIVNDVDTNPHFYGQIDLKTGYQTRNLIAVPLVAGDERVGVLEVLNRLDGGPFTADERLILVSVADEIAFAVRNATIFDYVVNVYCKRRQGQDSCTGCERPLGSWTPCVRYREFLP